jgi:plastocyanin
MRAALYLAAVATALLPATAVAKIVHIEIKDLVFDPATATAAIGDTIEWSNGDFVAHTATAKAAGMDVMIPPNKTASFVVEHAGTIDYFCRFHPNMKGRLTVEAQ